MESIKEAKEYLRENYKKGCKCPCCDQVVRLYKRKLNSGMAITLIQMHKHSNNFFHVKDMLREKGLHNGHDWSLLKYWGLIQELDVLPGSTKKSSGQYRVTEKGVDFVYGRINLPKHILIYNKRFQGFSDEETTIKESLGDDFNYYELLNQTV
jgi:hypothetical protein